MFVNWIRRVFLGFTVAVPRASQYTFQHEEPAMKRIGSLCLLLVLTSAGTQVAAQASFAPEVIPYQFPINL
jgi:hypothetical protein